MVGKPAHYPDVPGSNPDTDQILILWVTNILKKYLVCRKRKRYHKKIETCDFVPIYPTFGAKPNVGSDMGVSDLTFEIFML